MAIIVAVGNAGAAVAQLKSEAAAVTKESLRERYAAHVLSLKAPFAHSHWTYKQTSSLDTRITRASGEIYIKGERRLWIRRDQGPTDDNSAAAMVACVTPTTGFELRHDAHNSAYQITAIAGADNEERRHQIEIRAALRIDGYVYAAVQLGGLSMQELLQDEQTLKTAKMVKRDGRDCVEMVFRFQDGRRIYKSATAVMDPAYDFALREWELEFRTRTLATVSTRNATIVPQRLPSGYVVPKSVRIEDITLRANAKPFHRVREVEFTEITLDDIDDSQFTLAAFGLSSP